MTTTVARSTRYALIGLAACLLLLLLAAAADCAMWSARSGDVERIDGVFDGLPDGRTDRPRARANAVNILLMGTDRRSDVGTTGLGAAAPPWVPGAQRTDTLMLVHIDGSRRAATVVSFPRDAWVHVPGHGMAKINAAYSYGGPSLAVATVEALTDVRIDHLAVVDWEGFREMTDAVGGVTVTVPRDRPRLGPRHHLDGRSAPLDGQQALDYVGQRYGLPGGDLDRIRRQQDFLRDR